MYLEVLGFWSLICLILFVIAEITQHNHLLGLLGAILLIFLGAWLMVEQIQIKTGETTFTTETSTINYSISNLSQGPSTGNSSINYQYTPAVSSFFNLNQTVGIVFLLVGAWASYKYASGLRDG